MKKLKLPLVLSLSLFSTIAFAEYQPMATCPLSLDKLSFACCDNLRASFNQIVSYLNTPNYYSRQEIIMYSGALPVMYNIYNNLVIMNKSCPKICYNATLSFDTNEVQNPNQPQTNNKQWLNAIANNCNL